jgi:selenocysteine lyase/cysteine desulfurase
MLTAPASDRDYFTALRKREFARLDAEGIAYLDYTGSALYGESQLETYTRLLRGNCFGNPHSEHSPSRRSSATIARARRAVLAFLGVDETTHTVCFTANTSAAVKLVAESYPFSRFATCLLTADNHNSINGLREYARRAGARVLYLPLGHELRLLEPERRLVSLDGPGLFGFPAQSNFSGVRHPLELAALAKGRGFDVLVDAAAFAPSHRIDMNAWPAVDFLVFSFYKLFGLPTGLGALVARREALGRLVRPWFAGGTVLFASVEPLGHRLRQGPESFEDGTPDFLGIAALEPGFALLDEVGMTRLQGHVEALAGEFLAGLGALRRHDGEPAVVIYGPSGLAGRGGTVAFNVLDAAGEVVPYWIVEERARRAGVAVRGGCFCNPGAAQAALRLDGGRSARCWRKLADDFTPERFASCLGEPVGAVRVSFGLANDARDLRRALELVAGVAEENPAAADYGAARIAATKESASSGVTTKRSSPASTSTALRRSLA